MQERRRVQEWEEKYILRSCATTDDNGSGMRCVALHCVGGSTFTCSSRQRHTTTQDAHTAVVFGSENPECNQNSQLTTRPGRNGTGRGEIRDLISDSDCTTRK